ncbi:MAG: N-glycosylase/DNA lyase [Candidatus Odinarchaeia archaeon]
MCYEKLLKSVEALKKSEVKDLIDTRLNEFKENGRKSSEEIFKELCFCILTANFNAEKSIKIQEAIDNGFLALSECELAEKLRELGHRYPNTRAKYIVEARKYKNMLNNISESFTNLNNIRDWLVSNVKGLGYKEASHFLRNIGYTEFAIIDFHIIDILVKYKLIKKPKTLSKRKYLEIEELLKKIADADDLNLNLAELDLYLWYMETGKVLK